VRIYLPEIKRSKGEAVDLSFRGSFHDFFGRDEYPAGGSIEVIVSACAESDKVIVRGSMQASLDIECSRCLRLFRQEMHTEFHEAFLIVSGSADDEDPDLLATAAANELEVRGNYLYLKEFLRQVFILDQEYSPLCRPDCRGLCKDCGTDLNSGICDCRLDSQVDLRLIKLKELIR
jgi:uncharacterized protein